MICQTRYFFKFSIFILKDPNGWQDVLERGKINGRCNECECSKAVSHLPLGLPLAFAFYNYNDDMIDFRLH